MFSVGRFGGLGGLSASWYLGARHEVTLFDRTVSPGMGAEGFDVPTRSGHLSVDVPLRVFTEGYYPTLAALYREAGVRTERVDYASSFAELRSEAFVFIRPYGPVQP